MKKHIALVSILAFLASQLSFGVGKIQQQDIKTLSQCVTAGATGATCLPLDQQIWDTTNNQQLSASIANGQLGGGGGGKNYLSAYTASTGGGAVNSGNGDFETGTASGWSLAHSSLSGTTPTSTATAGSAFSSTSGGSAASVNLSLTASSSSPLQKKYSGVLASSAASTAGDMLISSAFYIDSSDKAKILSVSFDYSVVSGTLDQSGTSSNSFAVWVYDVTNGAWIQPVGVYNLVGAPTVKGVTFQSTSNSTQYQLALVNINATSGAYSLKLDELSVGPQESVNAPAMTDFISYTPTLIGSSSNPSLGNGTSIGYWRRVGDSAQVIFQIEAGSSTTAGSGSYSVSLPSGLTIDTTKAPVSTTAPINTLGTAQINSGGSVLASASIQVDTASLHAVYFWQYAGGTGGGSQVSDSSPSSNWFQHSGNTIAGSFTVPIVGWSSNTSMSSDASPTDVSFSAYTNSTGIGSSGANIAFPNVTVDNHSGWNSGGSYWVAPVSGNYTIDGTGIVVPSSGAVNDTFFLTIAKNGSTAGPTVGAPLPSNGQFASAAIHQILTLKVGDQISLVGSQNQPTGSVNFAGLFSIHMNQGNQPISQDPSVVAKYYMSSSTSVSATTSINYDTKVEDTANAVTTGSGTWKFTAPVSGHYSVCATDQISGSSCSIAVWKNGSADTYILTLGVAGTNGPLNGCTTMQLNQGDYIDTRPNNTVTITGGSAPYTASISIYRIGN